MAVTAGRPHWIARFPFLVSIALGTGSLALGIAWQVIDGGVLTLQASPGHYWIILVSGILGAQIGLVLAISAGVSAPQGTRLKSSFPGVALSAIALAFWALTR